MDEYKITLLGCDDSTTIDISLEPEQAALIEEMVRRFEAVSSYQCMPTMEIEKRSADQE